MISFIGCGAAMVPARLRPAWAPGGAYNHWLTDQSIARRHELASVSTQQERAFLRRALELAELGRGKVSPNPLVGAVLVRDGEAIGEGHHAELGGPHAEVAALEDCRRRGADPAGATMYVTLEPCAHHGRQPPCTDALVAARVGRVVIGSDDPSEKASGRGPGVLRDEGIEVALAEGAEAAAARSINQAFRKRARTGRPHVVFKSALTLDGRVATPGGESRWISGEQSRDLVHRWRGELDAIAVGIGTVLADDPVLTARSSGAPSQPTRVVFDSTARLPLDSALVESVSEAPLVVVAAAGAPEDRMAVLQDAGAEVIVAAGSRADRVTSALTMLGRREITSVLLEGGPTLAGAFLEAGEVDELRLFIAPRVLGGGRPVIEGTGADRMADAHAALSADWERVGEDLLVRARMREW
jgi:diaminohydroxyphosphoribosylaminopyrimidine deaminase/5-amino-6-(5-phosphoribosylamino)uracil reductase